ncbi:MAG: OmpA family protein, partial [Rhodoferax sp.]
EIRRDYNMWLAQIANRSAKARACLQIAGHTSRSGAEPLNERLSLQRATQVRQQIVNQNKRLAGQLTTLGLGSSKAIIGSGTDDARDAVDRRVEFAVQDCKTAG